MAKANKDQVEELFGTPDFYKEKAEAAVKTASKATRKKTGIAAKEIGKTADVAMEKPSKKTTGKTASDATILKATTTAKNINGTVRWKRRKIVDERSAKATGKRPDKATKLLKDAILKAAIKAGNQLGEDGLVSYLEVQTLKNASSFLTLLGNVLPAELNNNGQGIKTDGQTK